MVKMKEKIPTDLEWQVTTKAISCPMVGLRVTIMVKNDWTSRCCWYEEHKESNFSTKLDKCKGSSCSYPIDFRDSLVREELGR